MDVTRKYIGTLPKDWSLERLNNVAELYGRIGWQGLTSDEYQDEGPWLVTGTDFQNGTINWNSCVHISNRRWEEAFQIKLSPNDLLITKDGTVGKLAIVENMPGRASLNSGVMRIAPKSELAYSTRFLYYVLQTDVFTEWFKDINAGASTIQHLFQKDFKHFVFPAPPLEEQELIAKKLSRECRLFDDAITALETQISTLERYRASVIHEAVTRGLDPTAPTKPSNVDWIGDIPQGWEMKPLGYLGSFQNGISKDGVAFGAGYPFVSYSDAYNNRVLPRVPSGLVRSTTEERHRYSARYGDVFFTRTSETIDEIAYASTCLEGIENATFAGFLIRFRPKGDQLDPRFGSYYFRSPHLRRYFSREMVIVTRASLGQQLLKRLPVLLPPLEEQAVIADYLDARTAAIDAVIATKRKQLDVLKRRRQSLIYEYVTGKHRVGEEG